jgi:hypothetical protein
MKPHRQTQNEKKETSVGMKPEIKSARSEMKAPVK